MGVFPMIQTLDLKKAFDTTQQGVQLFIVYNNKNRTLMPR